MITLLEANDVEKLFMKISEINERTKKHTAEIKELQKEREKLSKGDFDSTSNQKL